MALTVEKLRSAVNTSTADDAVLAECVALAEALLRKHVGDAYANIPGAVFDRAWLVVAVDDFNLRKAPNGVLNQQFTTSDGGVGVTPLRLSRDPLRGARPLLQPWVDWTGFA